MKAKKSVPSELVKLCVRALEEKKAGDVTVLDVSAQSSITDFLVIATATSEPHLRALRVELEKELDGAKVHLVGTEAPHESGWTVIDAFDVMIHLFTSPMRERYGLERLWQDATQVPLKQLLNQPKPRAKARKTAAPKASKSKSTKAKKRVR